MSKSFYKNTVNLILKLHKNSTKKDFRSISLINIDTKIHKKMISIIGHDRNAN